MLLGRVGMRRKRYESSVNQLARRENTAGGSRKEQQQSHKIASEINPMTTLLYALLRHYRHRSRLVLQQALSAIVRGGLRIIALHSPL